jgi:hypothetical protein
MPDYVRVTDTDTGHRLTILRSELPHGNYRELKADAVNELGDPLPPEHGATKPTSTTTGHTATTSKENS